jgi:hypothetical protein
MKGYFWLFSAILSCTCLACENDVALNKSNITGYWVVGKALRDKHETRLLADVFFQFGTDGKMFTNLPNTADVATDFEVKANQIIQKTVTPIVYAVQDFSDSTLVLALEMNNTPFEIYLIKSVAGKASPIDSLPQPTDTL